MALFSSLSLSLFFFFIFADSTDQKPQVSSMFCRSSNESTRVLAVIFSFPLCVFLILLLLLFLSRYTFAFGRVVPVRTGTNESGIRAFFFFLFNFPVIHYLSIFHQFTLHWALNSRRGIFFFWRKGRTLYKKDYGREREKERKINELCII